MSINIGFRLHVDFGSMNADDRKTGRAFPLIRPWTRRLSFLSWGIALSIVLAALLWNPSSKAAAEDVCNYEKAVCAARGSVFRISAFDPLASAVRVSADMLVTTRHSVADAGTARVFTADGKALTAEVLPSGYTGDLVLLRVPDLPAGPVLKPEALRADKLLHTVGTDVRTREATVYAPGALLFAPADGFPLARIHHSAYSQPGTSGGALLDGDGRWVGIVTSGGEGRFEAIPATALETLRAATGDEHAAASAETGAAVRVCVTLLEDLRRQRARRMEDQPAKALTTSCRRSGNRQLLDLAAQTLGRKGRAEASVALFEEALEEDPHAVNARIGLAVSLALARRHEGAVSHLRWLMDGGIEDVQVLRLAIQAGVWGGDEALARRALERIEAVNPQMAPTARRFVDNPPPKPQPRPRTR